MHQTLFERSSLFPYSKKKIEEKFNFKKSILLSMNFLLELCEKKCKSASFYWDWIIWKSQFYFISFSTIHISPIYSNVNFKPSIT